MHPLVKIISVLIISVSVGLNGWSGIILTMILLLPFYLQNFDYLSSAWRMIKRLKWFYLSILILYLLLDPQSGTEPLNWQHWTGLELGTYRISILVVIVLSVNLLFRSSQKEELLSGLYLLIKPFKWLGFRPDRFVLRAYLTLDYIQVLDQLFAEKKAFFKQNRSLKKLIPGLADFISQFLQQGLKNGTEQTQQSCAQPIQIKLLNYPLIREWIVPSLLILVYIYLPPQLEQLL